MRRELMVGVALTIVSTLACARLPAPTPEQQAAAAQKKSAEEAEAKQQQEALTRVQDDLAARFGNGRSQGAMTARGNLPQKAVEPPGDAGPHGGTKQSAEAHSAPSR